MLGQLAPQGVYTSFGARLAFSPYFAYMTIIVVKFCREGLGMRIPNRPLGAAQLS